MAKMDEFITKNQNVCQFSFTDPQILKKEAKDFPEILAKFKEQAKKNTQGLGNKETDHEVAFAAVLEKCGFQFLLKKKKNDHLKMLSTLNDGSYYIYQVNGSQQSLDFQTILIQNHKITKTFTYDLKHSTTNQFYLNDGWFLENIIYVITWMPNKETTKTMIGLGQHIPNQKEKEKYSKIVEAKKLLNSQVEDDDDVSLMIYHRFANRFSCKKFTDEWSTQTFQNVMRFIS